jgi:plastocyanin
MRPRIATLGLLILALLLATVHGCGGSKSNPVVPPVTLELDSPNLAGMGVGVYQHTFANAGTFGYHCKFHSMSSTVTVASGQAASASVTITDNAFSGAVSVAPGGTVTWTNNGNNTHTVTSN